MSTAYPQLPSWLVIGFTGHRTLAHPDAVAEAVHHAIYRIGLLHPRLAGVSSAASGSDTLFAEAMAKRGWPFTLILPFPCERFHEDFQDQKDWKRVQELMAKAVDVEVIYQSTAEREAAMHCGLPQSPTSEAVIPKTDEQKKADNDAYMDAGYRTIERADVIIAVWDGQPAKGWGGTAHAVKYAQEMLKPIIIIHPDSGEIIEEKMDVLKRRFAHRESGNVFDATADPAAEPRARVEGHFKAVNAEATKHGPISRLLVRISLLLFLAASTIGYAALVFHVEGWLDYIFSAASFGCVAAGTIVMIVHAKRHDLWLRCRVDAEVCRSFLATWDIRKHATLSHQPRPPVPGLRTLFATLRMLRQLDAKKAPGPASLEETRAKYDETRVDNQIRYFVKQQKKAARTLHRSKLAMKAFNVIALICSLTVVGLSIRHSIHPHISEVLDFLAVSLPLAVTAMGITLMTQESARRAARYREMLEELHPLQRRLRASDTWDALARVATDVEEELLQELVEWRSFIRFTRDVAHPE